MLNNKKLNQYSDLPESLLLENLHIIDKSENIDFDGHIIIENGKIAKIIQENISSFKGERIDCKNALVMPGFFDMHVHLREPGREDEETIKSGSLAAANGGFTAVACMPNTEPAIHTQEIVNYIKKQAENSAVEVFPIAAITKDRKGNELAPIAELVDAGAVAISDDGSPVMNSELMRRALEYSKMYNIPVLGHEEDIFLAKDRHMHEGFYSTKLGLPGIPSLSEDVMVARDIMLTEFTGGSFHVCHISTKGSVDLVRKAKEKGLPVTCEVTPHHFTLTDKEVESFNTNTKMNPPLRSAEDVAAILEGLKDGTIDAIATDHAPHSIEEKEAEYIYAPFGITGLETAFGLMYSELVKKGIIKLERLYDLCVANPRKILNIPIPKIKVGETANLSAFDLNKSWTLADSKRFSKSNNTPFMNMALTGKSFLVINNGKMFKS